MIRVGCHLSIAGGFSSAARYAVELGCETLQVFSRSPRGGKAKPLSSDDVRDCRSLMAEAHISPLVIHVPYYINLAATEAEAIEYTRQILIDEMARASTLGASYVVTHLGHGNHSDASRRVARMLDSVLCEARDPQVLLCLENTAGQGSEIGYRFGDISDTIMMSNYADRIGFCYDTCHGFGAGYDLVSAQGFESTIDEIRSTVGFNKLRVIHANDSKEPLGSRRDRHEHIGEGYIGRQGFQRLINCEAFFGAVAILETPLTTFTANKKNIDTLKSLRAGALAVARATARGEEQR